MEKMFIVPLAVVIFLSLLLTPLASASVSVLIITNSSSIDGMQVAFNLSHQTEMNDNFSDIRFYSQNWTSIPYWIQDSVDGEWAYTWLKLPANESYIYMTYGSGSAQSESDIDAVFEFADDWSNQTSLDTNGGYHVQYAIGDIYQSETTYTNLHTPSGELRMLGYIYSSQEESIHTGIQLSQTGISKIRGNSINHAWLMLEVEPNVWVPIESTTGAIIDDAGCKKTVGGKEVVCEDYYGPAYRFNNTNDYHRFMKLYHIQ